MIRHLNLTYESVEFHIARWDISVFCLFAFMKVQRDVFATI